VSEHERRVLLDERAGTLHRCQPLRLLGLLAGVPCAGEDRLHLDRDARQVVLRPDHRRHGFLVARVDGLLQKLVLFGRGQRLHMLADLPAQRPDRLLSQRRGQLALKEGNAPVEVRARGVEALGDPGEHLVREVLRLDDLLRLVPGRVRRGLFPRREHLADADVRLAERGLRGREVRCGVAVVSLQRLHHLGVKRRGDAGVDVVCHFVPWCLSGLALRYDGTGRR